MRKDCVCSYIVFDLLWHLMSTRETIEPCLLCQPERLLCNFVISCRSFTAAMLTQPASMPFVMLDSCLQGMQLLWAHKACCSTYKSYRLHSGSHSA